MDYVGVLIFGSTKFRYDSRFIVSITKYETHSSEIMIERDAGPAELEHFNLPLDRNALL